MAFELYIPGLDSHRLATLDPLNRRRAILAHADLKSSSGPWIAIANSEPVFDAIDPGCGIGFNASPLFGVLHHPAAWNGNGKEDSFMEVLAAMQSYGERNLEFGSKFGVLVTPREKIRAYIAANVVDQFADQLAILEATCHDIVRQSANRIAGFKEAVTIKGRHMLIQFPETSRDPLLDLLAQRILANRTNSQAIEFQLPLNLSSIDFECLVDRIVGVWESHHQPKLTSLSFDDDWGVLRNHVAQYKFHTHLLAYKLASVDGQARTLASEIDFVHSLLPSSLASAEVVFLNQENWLQHRHQVAAMQKKVYEPSRQTAIEKFDALISDEFGFGLLILMEKEIAGMAFIGPLDLFPEERGTTNDPYWADRHTMYTLDLTVADNFRGSLGRVMKQAITLMVVAAGHNAIHGRNRDRLAGGMWAINLGLGSFELKRLIDDYPDKQPYRDCIYYRCPLRWPKSIPLDHLNFNENNVYNELAQVVNN